MAQSAKIGLVYKREFRHRSPHHEPLEARKGQKSIWNPGGKQHLQAREREIKALDLRKRGKSYNEIGIELGMTDAAAYQMVMRVLEAYDHDIRENVPCVRQIELKRLDQYIVALQKRINTGDPKAILVALKVSERRAKLMGLDAPLKVAATDTEGNTIEKMADGVLDQEIAHLIVTLGVITQPIP
jgi:hypothetical protein